MKACGVIAEYNPFHKGHAYQIEELRAKSDADLVIAVMSGNFLQRGEPAFLDKWTRTQMALAGGVDLVIELPVLWSVQPADYFADGAMRIFKALNIDYLSFGVEEGNAADFLEAATFMIENEAQIDQELEDDNQMNLPYAKKMKNILLSIDPEFPLNLQPPNVQLGLSYQKELIKKGIAKQVQVIPIKRKGAGYREETIMSQTKIASGTALRRAIFQEKSIQRYIPGRSYFYMEEQLQKKVSWNHYFPYLKYQLLIQSKADLRDIYQMTEGLENRLKSAIHESNHFDEFMGKVKTKRYTQTRLQRLFTYVLLNIRKEAVDTARRNQIPIRLLGFNSKGQAYLNQEKDSIREFLISNVNQQTKLQLKNEIQAGHIYQLGNQFIKKQDFTRMPIKFD